MSRIVFITLFLLFSHIHIAYTSSGGICESKYISTDRCYEAYGTQLGEIIVRSMVDCTHYCNTLDGCRSILYDPSTKECRTNSDTLKSAPGDCFQPIKYWEFVQNSCQAESSMGKPCSTSSDCSDVLIAECRDGVCKCTLGYSYHGATKQCFSDCGQRGYGSTYQEIPGVIMMGFFEYNFRPMEAPGCKALCINETRFVCRTAEAYVAANGVKGCQLSWETFYTNPEAYQESAESITFIRDCA